MFSAFVVAVCTLHLVNIIFPFYFIHKNYFLKVPDVSSPLRVTSNAIKP